MQATRRDDNGLLRDFRNIIEAIVRRETIGIGGPAIVASPTEYARPNEVHEVALEGLLAHLFIEYPGKIAQPRLAVFANERDDAPLTTVQQIRIHGALRRFGAPQRLLPENRTIRGRAKR